MYSAGYDVGSMGPSSSSRFSRVIVPLRAGLTVTVSKGPPHAAPAGAGKRPNRGMPAKSTASITVEKMDRFLDLLMFNAVSPFLCRNNSF